MQLKEAKHYVTAARALGAEIVCITGGEPMLYPNLVKKIIAECCCLSFAEIWLFTNGFWANSVRKASTIVEKLESLGITKMFFSVDYFHQSFVPVEFVKNAIDASLEHRLEVCVDSRFVGGPNEENEFNSATRSHLKFLRNLLSKIEVVKARPMFVGRAAESLAYHVKMEPLSEILKEECPGAWAGSTLRSPLGVDINEFGFITICPGLSIGNGRRSSFRRIIKKYDYRDGAVIEGLCDEGFQGLMNLACENRFVPKEAYVDGCHFCYETRKFLRNIFPQSLVLPTGKSF